MDVKLNELLQACRKAAVSFALNYSEADDTWYVVIHSAAPSEAYVGKNLYSLEYAMDDAITWVKGLSK